MHGCRTCRHGEDENKGMGETLAKMKKYEDAKAVIREFKDIIKTKKKNII